MEKPSKHLKAYLNLPDDWFQITPEEAIRLYERGAKVMGPDCREIRDYAHIRRGTKYFYPPQEAYQREG